jgi:hypothetical protein
MALKGALFWIPHLLACRDIFFRGSGKGISQKIKPGATDGLEVKIREVFVVHKVASEFLSKMCRQIYRTVRMLPATRLTLAL